MKVKFFCPLWGSEGLEFRSFCEKVKSTGFDGVEMSLPMEPGLKEEILEVLKEFDLQLIAQHWETTSSDYNNHKKEFRQRLMNLASGNPLFINSQTGKDFFSLEENAGLIQIAREVTGETGIKIIHETHRGKFSFAAHVTLMYLTNFPDLRLGLDISHWCNVAESMLGDQAETVSLALSRTDHIHARIGFPEGPQVPDPRAPEWKETFDVHLSWWKKVIKTRKEDGWKEFSVTPEFGPFPYMTILPVSRQPISDQWDINVFMMQFLKIALNE